MNKYKVPLRIDFAGGWSDCEIFTDRHCGYISNMTINTSFGKEGSGLASSSRDIIINYLKSVKNFPQKIDIMAEECYKLEKDFIMAGRQDIYSLVFGGFNCFRFYRNKYISQEKYKLPYSLSDEFSKRIVLFYRGDVRNGHNICKEISAKNKNKTFSLMKKLSKCGLQFAKELKRSNFIKCAFIMSKNWQIQKQLAVSISNPMVDSIYDFAIGNGAIGGKLSGAGGGGIFIFYSENKKLLEEKLKDKFKKGEIVPFEFQYRSVIELNA